MPYGSKTDLLLAKAEPVSGDGSASGISYLERERGVRICERKSSADTKINEEGGAGGVSGSEAEIHMQLVLKIMVRKVVPLQPMEVTGGVGIHLQPVGDPLTGADGCTQRRL